jgi:hypothetical protein
MKKVFSILMVAVALMVAAPAQAQLIKFGVKGGLNLTEIDMKGGADWWEENTTGFFIGPMMEVTIPVIGLGVEAAVMYSQRGDHATKQQGIEVPLNLKYTIGLGSMLGIYVAAGPDFYFNFKDFGDFVIGGTTPQKKSTQVAINVGAGVKLLRKLQIGANYQIPVSNAYEWKSGDIKMKGWQASIAYIF